MSKFVVVPFLLCCVSVAGEETKVYSGTGTVASAPPPQDKPIILLGGLFPVHTNEDNLCGEILDLGLQRLEAMVMATQLINASPDLLPEATLGFEIRDTCVEANLALEESLSFVRDREGEGDNSTALQGISGVVGAASSSITIVVANLLRLFQVPQISYASTAKILSDKTRFDYFFRTVPPDSLQARTMADIIFRFHWTYIHAIFSDDAYGSEGIEAFFGEIERQNKSDVCVATVHKITPGVTSESVFDEVVLDLNQEWVGNSSVVVLFGQLSTALGVLSAMQRLDDQSPGFAQQFTWIGSDAWGDQLPSEFHAVAKGMLSVSPKASVSAEFDQYFTSLNPLNYSSNPWFAEYWEFIFNCSLAPYPSHHQRQACDPTQQAISPESGYRQNSKVTFTVDAVYAFAYAIDDLISDMCPDKNPCDQILKMGSGGTAIDGELLLEYLKNVSFAGASADNIEFDSSGDEQGDFVIKNLKRMPDGSGFFYDTVGVWTPHSFLDLYGRIEWSNQRDEVPLSVCSLPCAGGEFPEPIPDQVDCCWLCQPCLGDRLVSTGLACSECGLGYKPNQAKTECVEIVPDYLQWGSPWAIVIIIVTLVGLLATAGVVLLWVLCYKHPLIKANSRELSFIMLAGLALCYVVPFFFLAKPSPGICTMRRLGVGISFTICYSALLVKTNRVYRIFTRAQTSLQKPQLISPQSQILFTLLLISVQVVIAVVWLTVERPAVKILFSDFDGELLCGESPIVGFFIHVAYNFILLCTCTFYGLRSRKIPQSFNETKLINFTAFSSVLLWVGLVPTYFATATVASVYQIISLVIAIITSATVMLFILFLSKVYFLISSKRKEMREINENQGQATRGQGGTGTSLNVARKFSMDLLSVRNTNLNTHSLMSPTTLSAGSGHSRSLNVMGLGMPKEGERVSSIGSFERSPALKKIPCADAFTQTTDEELVSVYVPPVLPTIKVTSGSTDHLASTAECDNQASAEKESSRVTSVEGSYDAGKDLNTNECFHAEIDSKVAKDLSPKEHSNVNANVSSIDEVDESSNAAQDPVTATDSPSVYKAVNACAIIEAATNPVDPRKDSQPCDEQA